MSGSAIAPAVEGRVLGQWAEAFITKRGGVAAEKGNTVFQKLEGDSFTDRPWKKAGLRCKMRIGSP